jgi:hypothetical protein
MATVTIKVPDKNSPGFARRLYRAAQFQERVKSEGFTAELITGMIDFLADYIEGDREQAREYLWDCTELQFNELIGAVSGGSAEQIPPPKLEPTATP